MVSNNKRGSSSDKPGCSGVGRGRGRAAKNTHSAVSCLSPDDTSSSSGNSNARPYNRAKTVAKDSEYVERRSKNNDAVRKSRQKARFKQEQIALHTESRDNLAEIHLKEHKRLTKMIEVLRKTITDESTSDEEAKVLELIKIDSAAQQDFEHRVSACKIESDEKLKLLKEEEENALNEIG